MQDIEGSFEMQIQQSAHNGLQGLTLLLAPKCLKNCVSHIDASHSRQPLVKGERLVRYEVNAVIGSVVVAGIKGWNWKSALASARPLLPAKGHQKQGDKWTATGPKSKPSISWSVKCFFWTSCILLPQRVCCPWLCAMPVQHAKAPEQAREDTSPRKIE
jgi:hypothetical protein